MKSILIVVYFFKKIKSRILNLLVGSRIYASRGLLLQCESLLEIATTIASLNGCKFIRVLVNKK